MLEEVYLIAREPRGWCVLIAGGPQRQGPFGTEQEACDAAADVARRSRRLGRLASVRMA